MIIKYNENAPKSYGPRYNGSWWIYDGIYITPQGYLFDVEGYSRVAHCYGFVIPFLGHIYIHMNAEIVLCGLIKNIYLRI